MRIVIEREEADLKVQPINSLADKRSSMLDRFKVRGHTQIS